MKLLSKSLAATTLVTISLGAFAHAKLETAIPKSGELLDKAPTEIVLHFNEALEAPFSKITLKDSKGATIKTEKATVDKAHPETLHLVTPKLSAGTYQVQWSTMTQDGHRAKDQYSFQVK
jgi:methionine-rich copper-binding protein CopC